MSVSAQLTDELAAHLVSYLGPFGLRYLKTQREFRRTAAYGSDHIIPMVTRNSDGSYTLGISFGVRHIEVERQRATLGLPTDRDTLTVAQNSFNVHPSRPIADPGPTYWVIRPSVKWAEMAPEIVRFIIAVALPWIERFADVRELRKAVATEDGWVVALRPWETVAAIDLKDGLVDDLAAYLTSLRARSVGWVAARRQELALFVQSIRHRLPPDSADGW